MIQTNNCKEKQWCFAI